MPRLHRRIQEHENWRMDLPLSHSDFCSAFFVNCAGFFKVSFRIGIAQISLLADSKLTQPWLTFGLIILLLHRAFKLEHIDSVPGPIPRAAPRSRYCDDICTMILRYLYDLIVEIMLPISFFFAHTPRRHLAGLRMEPADIEPIPFF
jgi:hypothetical protein